MELRKTRDIRRALLSAKQPDQLESPFLDLTRPSITKTISMEPEPRNEPKLASRNEIIAHFAPILSPLKGPIVEEVDKKF